MLLVDAAHHDAYKRHGTYEVRLTDTFRHWLKGLTDERAQDAITTRIVRVQSGLLGDHKSIGDKVSEFRIDVGQGYRLYYTVRGRTIIILLCGGEKRSQKRDIKAAKALAAELE